MFSEALILPDAKTGMGSSDALTVSTLAVLTVGNVTGLSTYCSLQENKAAKMITPYIELI